MGWVRILLTTPGISALFLAVLVSACGDGRRPQGGLGAGKSTPRDAGSGQDAEGSPADLGSPVADTGPFDLSVQDLGVEDAATPDFGTPDLGEADSGIPDSGSLDLGTPDFGTPDLGFADAGSGSDGGPSTINGVTVSVVCCSELYLDRGPAAPPDPLSYDAKLKFENPASAAETFLLTGASITSVFGLQDFLLTPSMHRAGPGTTYLDIARVPGSGNPPEFALPLDLFCGLPTIVTIAFGSGHTLLDTPTLECSQ